MSSSKFVYTPEMLDFLQANVAGTPLKKLTEEFNKRFGADRSKRHILDACRLRGWSNGLLHHKSLFPQDVCDFIYANCKGRRAREMVPLLNKVFGTNYSEAQVSHFYTKHGITSGVASTYVPIGTVVFRKTEEMYYEKVKDGPNPAENWRPKHHLVWEAANGPIPADSVIIFLDGDRKNIALENLALCSKAVALELTRKNLRFSSADATKTGMLIAQLNTEVYKHQKKRRRSDEPND